MLDTLHNEITTVLSIGHTVVMNTGASDFSAEFAAINERRRLSLPIVPRSKISYLTQLASCYHLFLFVLTKPPMSELNDTVPRTPIDQCLL